VIADFDDIWNFAEANLEEAGVAATTIQFSVEKYSSKHLQEGGIGSIRAGAVGSEPEYAKLTTNFGMSAWAVVLSVDMRGSSSRAIRVGAKDTYLTMHTYLPTMAELVGRADGLIVGLRGDGLFASFGLTKTGKNEKPVTSEVAESAVSSATRCGKAMQEAISDIINPLLDGHDIDGDLEIGVGIDVGDIVVTRIGLRDANEVTAYGAPVNTACKMAEKTNDILMTNAAHDMYPTTKGGRMSFFRSSNGYRPLFPADMVMLERKPNPIRHSKAR
jgi:class 3 adenylate cyclase